LGQRRLKLCDFGLAAYLHSQPLFQLVGTPNYVAPEMIRGECGYGLKVDVWALGAILYILLVGYPPFLALEGNTADLYRAILEDDVEFASPDWDEISEKAKDLISLTMHKDVAVRFSAEGVLTHPWIVVRLGSGFAKSTITLFLSLYYKGDTPLVQQT